MPAMVDNTLTFDQSIKKGLLTYYGHMKLEITKEGVFMLEPKVPKVKVHSNCKTIEEAIYFIYNNKIPERG